MTQRHSSVHSELRQTRPFRSHQEEVVLAFLRTAAVIKRPAARLVEGRGISSAQYNVLRILRGAGEEGMPTLGIRERLVEEAAGITRLIDKLEQSGLVRRDRSSADRRQVMCRITESGLAILAELDDPIQAAHASALSMLSEDDMNELLVILDRIREGCRGMTPEHAGNGDAEGEPEGEEVGDSRDEE